MLHHNLSITLLLGSKAKTVLTGELCCIQTKVYRLYRKNSINGHFSVKSIHFCLNTIWLFILIVSKQKSIDYIEKKKTLFMVIFLYSLYILFGYRTRLYRKLTINGHYTPPHNSGGVLWFHVGRP